MTDAWEIIASAKALLLDFDGPITALMPPPLNAEAADRARAALQVPSLSGEILTTTDHLAVLSFTAERFPGRFRDVERACAEAEIDCARSSQPSPEARDLVGCAQQRSIPVAVVSNNSVGAVRAFRQRFVWAEPLAVLACRTPEVAARLKPDPFLVYKALEALHVGGGDCVFVGDSVSDVKAGISAGVRVVGLAKNLERGRQLLEAGSIALIDRAR